MPHSTFTGGDFGFGQISIKVKYNQSLQTAFLQLADWIRLCVYSKYYNIHAFFNLNDFFDFHLSSFLKL